MQWDSELVCIWVLMIGYLALFYEHDKRNLEQIYLRSVYFLERFGKFEQIPENLRRTEAKIIPCLLRWEKRNTKASTQLQLQLPKRKEFPKKGQRHTLPS
jgi:hypothetical protein